MFRTLERVRARSHPPHELCVERVRWAIAQFDCWRPWIVALSVIASMVLAAGSVVLVYAISKNMGVPEPSRTRRR